MIVNLDELHFGELFEIRHKGLCDGVQRAIRLTTTGEIDMHNAVGIFDFAVAVETVQHERETLVTFHVAGTFEVFIEYRADQIPCGWNEARHSDFIRQLPADQTIVICEVDIDFHEQWRTRRSWSVCLG